MSLVTSSLVPLGTGPYKPSIKIKKGKEFVSPKSAKQIKTRKKKP